VIVLTHLTGLVGPLVSFLLAGVGWMLFEFVGRPIRRFFDIRAEIKRQTLLAWNLPELASIDPADWMDPSHQDYDVRHVLEDLTAQLISFAKSETMAAWFVRRLGYRPIEAARILRSITLALGTRYEERGKSFERLEFEWTERLRPRAL
jgi:hypothetical protein